VDINTPYKAIEDCPNNVDIDRLYCFYNFDDNRPGGWSSRLAGQGRKAILAAICEQKNKDDMGFTLDAMRLPLEALGYEIIGELPVW